MKHAIVAMAAGVMVGCAGHARVEKEPARVTVDQTLNAFHAAAANADYAGYFANWTGESVFLGTDATERWEGDAFKAFARPYFERGQGWTYLPRKRNVSVSEDGRTAWFDELLENEKYGECRGSGVLLRRGERWVIVQYNLSFPIPNDLAGETTGRIREFLSRAK